MSKNQNVSIAVIRRLPRYYRYLSELLDRGVDKISSKNLAEIMHLTASQIRQDFNCFGGFGQQGYGYNVAALRAEIKAILGLENQLDTILIGAGNLGRAFASHLDFKSGGFNLLAVFDQNPALEGQVIGGVKVHRETQLPEFCREHKPKVAILCIPATATESIVSTLIECGITNFWNFSHYDIAVRFPGVTVENVHLGDSLMTLCYQISNKDHPVEAEY